MKASAKITTLILMSIFSVTAWAGDTINSISPNSGPISGGQTVRLRGTFTAGSPAVTVGGTAATVLGTPTTSVIDIVTPAGTAAGNADIVVNGGTAFTYVYIARNNLLRVVVSANIAKRVIIRWGASTSPDDTPAARQGTYLPFNWTVRDNSVPAGQVDLETSYRSDDANNNKVMTIANASGGGLGVTVSGAVVATAGNGIAVGAAPGSDQVMIGASLTAAGTITDLSTTPTLGSIADNTQEPLVINYNSPTALSVPAKFNTVNSYTVTLTAVGN